jgi:branched-chain amino acid transport system permease protein
MNKFHRIFGAQTIGYFLLVLVFLAPVLLLDTKSYYLRIATIILLFSGMSSAWNLIGGYANQISLGHAAFFGLGAYTSTLLLKYLSLSPWLGMVGAGLIAGISSLAVGIPTFRLRGHYYALATLAFAEILRILSLFFRDYTGGAVGLTVPYLGESLSASVCCFWSWGSAPAWNAAAWDTNCGP